MRQPRIKIAAEEAEAVYHCMSRSVNGEPLFDSVAREVLRKQFWQVAQYCGVQIVTYAIMANHFHMLVRVPQKTVVPDAELLRRYSVLYPKQTRYQTARLEVIRKQLKTDTPEAVTWRKRQLALMGDVSQFMKLVKQRFSTWFNRSHNRYGTLWAERFKSVLAEPEGQVPQIMAAYIDLNCVRAGLARDPKDYRFCGYAEAVASCLPAQQGLISIFGGANWPEAQTRYRHVLFGTGAGPRESGTQLSREELSKVIKEGGQLTLAALLRCQIRYFTDGAVLGSKAFVTRQLAVYHRRTDKRKDTLPRPLPWLTPCWRNLTTLRGLRGRGVG